VLDDPYHKPQNGPIRRVSRVNHVFTPRDQAEASRDSAPITEAEIQTLYEQVEKKNRWFHLTTGFRYLFSFEETENIPPSSLLQMELDQVFTLLRTERRKRAHWKRASIGLGLVFALLFLYIMVFVNHASYFYCLWATPFSFFAARVAASKKHQAATAALTRFDDVRAIGPLAEALEFQDKYVLPFVTRALIRLLPRLQASDSPLLDVPQRACLNRALNGSDTELILAILKAWEQVGDAAAIPVVQELSAANPESKQRSKISEAARECLPFLLQSTERQQVGSQLLRPFDPNQTPRNVLLRPSLPQKSLEPPDQLLRSTDDPS
jgi:hypothetical protein